jgi:hypothetical protein
MAELRDSPMVVPGTFGLSSVRGAEFALPDERDGRLVPPFTFALAR